MSVWHIHILNARNALTPILPAIRAAAREAVGVARDHADLPRFDLIVQAGREVIPEWGLVGHAPAPGLVQITLNPDRFDHALMVRALMHEFHHLIRWDRQGYGRSLGEALVSEGLAGHFVLQALGGRPDPWDAVRPGPGAARAAMKEWSRLDYNHAQWFFGKGQMRRWTGYGLGHRLIGAFLDQNPGETAVSLADAPADRFREQMRAMAKADTETADEDVTASGG